MSGFWTCHECGAEMYGFENCQFCGAHKGGGEAMSIRNITVQYVGNVLFLPKLERDVKLVVERNYETADQDKRFVMEQSENNQESQWFELFGTPERAARSIINRCGSDCIACLLPTDCPCYDSFGADDDDYDALLEWLRGDAE